MVMFKSRLIIVILSVVFILCIFFLSGCGGGSEKTPPPNLIDLTVQTVGFNEEMQTVPITGVNLQILGVNVGTYIGITSGDNASVVLSVPAGNYIIKLTKDGYATQYIDCKVSETDNDAVFPMMTWSFMDTTFGEEGTVGTVDSSKSIIYGTIKNDIDNVEGVRVSINPSDGDLYYIAEGGAPSQSLTETSTEGQFAFINLETGTYTLTFTRDGLTFPTRQVTINEAAIYMPTVMANP